MRLKTVEPTPSSFNKEYIYAIFFKYGMVIEYLICTAISAI